MILVRNYSNDLFFFYKTRLAEEESKIALTILTDRKASALLELPGKLNLTFALHIFKIYRKKFSQNSKKKTNSQENINTALIHLRFFLKNSFRPRNCLSNANDRFFKF